MKNKIFSALLGCTALSAATLEEMPTRTPVAVHADQHFSPHAGSPTLMSIYDNIQRGEDRYFPIDPDSSSGKLIRAARMGFVYLPLSYLAIVTQHEVFGHGYRIRSFGKDVAKVEGYAIGTPPPFGGGGGGTGFDVTEKFAQAHFQTSVIGGVEATAVMAHDLRMKWLTSNTVHAQDNLVHLFAHHDLTNYAISMLYTSDKKAADGHDLINYTQMLRRTYPKTNIRGRHLAALSMINFANPFDVIAWSSMHTYVVDGKNDTPLPMLKMGPVRTLPAFRLGLAPHGPEIYLENFMRIKDKPIYTYLKGGMLGDHHYYGLGLEHPHMLKLGNHAFGLKGNFWHHPKLLTDTASIHGEALFEDHTTPLDYSEDALKAKQLGGSLSATYRYELGERYGLQLEAGHKLAGFLPGEVMDRAPIFRGALSFNY